MTFQSFLNAANEKFCSNKSNPALLVAENDVNNPCQSALLKL